jgi:hypothetical protein
MMTTNSITLVLDETSKHSSKLSQVYLSILGFYMRTRIDSSFEPHHFAATNTFKDFRDNLDGTDLITLHHASLASNIVVFSKLELYRPPPMANQLLSAVAGRERH